MAWNVRTHFVPAMTGHSDSAAAPSMALAARRPGATNARYGDPADVARALLDEPAEAEADRGEEQHRVEDVERSPTRARTAGRSAPGARRPGPSAGWPSLLQRAAGQASGTRPRASCAGRAPSRAARRRWRGGRRRPRRWPCRRGCGRPAPRSARRCAATRGRASSRSSSVRKRSSTTSRVECRSISSRGEPSATIRPPSMITSRSHSCSASSM